MYIAVSASGWGTQTGRDLFTSSLGFPSTHAIESLRTHLVQHIISFFKGLLCMPQQQVRHFYVVEWQWLKDSLVCLFLSQHICRCEVLWTCCAAGAKPRHTTLHMQAAHHVCACCCNEGNLGTSTVRPETASYLGCICCSSVR